MEIILELGWTEQDQVYHVQLRRAQRVVYSINQKDLLFPKQVALHKVVALFGHMTYAKQVCWNQSAGLVTCGGASGLVFMLGSGDTWK